MSAVAVAKQPAAVAKVKTKRGKETPRAKFLRIAPKRMDRALRALALVSQLSTKSFAVTEADIEKIHTALDEALKSVKSQLRPSTVALSEKVGGFKFD
jgi:hypothetical protein